MNSVDNLERIITGLEELPNKYKTENALKQNGYVEGVCDSINLVMKLFVHNVNNIKEKSKAEITYDVIQNLKQMLINDDVIQNLKQMLINDDGEELANRL